MAMQDPESFASKFMKQRGYQLDGGHQSFRARASASTPLNAPVSRSVCVNFGSRRVKNEEVDGNIELFGREDRDALTPYGRAQPYDSPLAFQGLDGSNPIQYNDQYRKWVLPIVYKESVLEHAFFRIEGVVGIERINLLIIGKVMDPVDSLNHTLYRPHCEFLGTDIHIAFVMASYVYVCLYRICDSTERYWLFGRKVADGSIHHYGHNLAYNVGRFCVFGEFFVATDIRNNRMRKHRESSEYRMAFTWALVISRLLWSWPSDPQIEPHSSSS